MSFRRCSGVLYSAHLILGAQGALVCFTHLFIESWPSRCVVTRNGSNPIATVGTECMCTSQWRWAGQVCQNGAAGEWCLFPDLALAPISDYVFPTASPTEVSHLTGLIPSVSFSGWPVGRIVVYGLHTRPQPGPGLLSWKVSTDVPQPGSEQPIQRMDRELI